MSSSRRVRARFWIAGTVLVGIGMAVAAALLWRPALRQYAAFRIAAITGCDVRIGEVGVTLGRDPEVELSAIELGPGAGALRCRGAVQRMSVFFEPWGRGFHALEASGGSVALPIGAGLGGVDAPALTIEKLQLSARPQPDAFDLGLSGSLEHMPVQGAAVLETSKRRGLSELDVKVGSRTTAWIEVEGSIGELDPLRDIGLEAHFGWDDVRSLGALVGDPPDLGRVSGSMTVHDRAGPLGIYDFTLKGGRTGVFEIDAEGDFADVEGVHGLDAHVDFSARDLAVLGELVRRPLTPVGPVSFSGKVKAEKGLLHTEGLAARIGDTRLTGSLTGHFSKGDRPRLEANLDAAPLNVAALGFGVRRTDETSGATPPSTGGSGWSDEPFDLDWLLGFDATFALHARDVSSAEGPWLQEAQLAGELARGRLTARHVLAELDGDRLEGSLQVDAAATPPAFSLDTRAAGIDLSRLVRALDRSSAYSGEIQGHATLEASGVSQRALASTLRGRIAAASAGGTIAMEHARLLTRDFFSLLRPSRQEGTEKMNCLIVDFDVASGVATSTALVLDTKDLVIVGGGSIDLASRTLDLRFVPKPRDPSPLSTAASVRVTGSLDSPRVTMVKASAFKSSTKAVLGTLTWLTRTRGPLRDAFGAGKEFQLCAEATRGG